MIRCMVSVGRLFMAQARPESRDRKIAELQAEILELRARLAESEKLRIAALEDGLRLSQENEALKMQLTASKKSRK
jgi:hypothetical protein